MWYSWAAPQTGQVCFDTSGSAFNTLLAIYTGTNVTNLTVVGSNDDADGKQTSRVIFTAGSNTTYKIAVDSSGPGGDLTLNWNQSPAPVIISQPQGTNVVANANENAVFSTVAIGYPVPLTNFWRFQGTNAGAAITHLAITTNFSFAITNVQGSNAGYYSVIVSNSCGSVTSAVATLFVHGDSAAHLNQISYASTQFWFQIYGLTNRGYIVQTSTNLNSVTNWVPIYTNLVPTSIRISTARTIPSDSTAP